MITAYQIIEWDEHYENHKTRAMKNLSWFPCPNKHDGSGYTELMEGEDAGDLFAAWILMVQVASKSECRGLLVRRGRGGVLIAHDAKSLSRMTRLPAECFEKAFPVLDNIGWLAKVQCSPEDMSIGRDEDGATTTKGREGNRTEGKGIEQKEGSVPELLRGLELYEIDTRLLKNYEKNRAAWDKTYPHLNIDTEIRKAHVWEMVNPKRQKDDKARFIAAWLGRADENRGKRKDQSGRTPEEEAERMKARRAKK